MRIGESCPSENDCSHEHQHMDTYPIPDHKKTIGCKWVFKLMGTIERHKAHLVAKVLTQTKGIYYLKTFILVVKMTTIWVLLVLAASQNWHNCQLDVNTIFLHGDLKEEVYTKSLLILTLLVANLACTL